MTTRPLSVDEERVWRILAQHRGRAEAISASMLSFHAGISDRTIRRVVKTLIEEHGCPIASTPHPPAGYFIAEELTETITALESLKGRALSILTRMSRLQRTTLRATVGQLLLGIEEDAA